MTDAPERIWAGPSLDDKGVFWDVGHWDAAYDNGCIEYIRADLARPMTVSEAAISRGQDVVDYYEQCVCDAKTDSQRYIAELQMNAAKSVLGYMSEPHN